MDDELSDDFPNIEVLTRDEFRDEQQETVDQFLTVLIAILALSALIAILGIVNTLALSVFERTRELGVLRIVGMSRRQLRRMVRWESVVIAVIGGAIGVALGLFGDGRSRGRCATRVSRCSASRFGRWCCSSSGRSSRA